MDATSAPSTRTTVQFGVAEFLWGFRALQAGDVPLASHVGGLGFDVLEVLVPDERLGGLDDAAHAFAASGVQPLVLAPATETADPSSADEVVRQAGIERLLARVDAAVTLGGGLVSGPMYAPSGRARPLVPEEREAEFERACRSLAVVAEHAARRGVRLAVEPLNRFETDLVTTTARAVELCERIDSPAVGLLLDTFHMGIEERDVAAALGLAGERLLHLHACENDRGPLGGGHTTWPEVFAALSGAGFRGVISMESFGPGAEAVRAAARWRSWFPDPDVFARDGLAFLRDQCLQAGLWSWPNPEES